MIILKSECEINLMYEVGKLLVFCYKEIVKMIKLGVIIM